MKDEDKTREQLISELEEMRQRITQLEPSESERKRMEEALRISARQWQSTFDAISDAVCLLDSDCRILRCNTAMSNLLSKQISEIEGHTCWELMHHSSGPVEGCPIVRMRETRRKESLDLLVGDQWFEVSVDPWLNSDGNVIGAVHVISDITERKRAEKALQESEEKYRNLVERANDGVCIIQDGLVKYANSRQAEMWGGAVEEITDTPFVNYVHPDDLPWVVERYNRRMAGEQVPSVYEAALRRKDGSKAYAELNVGTINYLGKPAELVITRDMTEHKKAEETLIESEEKLRLMFQSVSDGVAVTDLKGVVTDCNERAVDMYGANSKQKILGRSCLEFIDQRDREKVAADMQRIIAGEKPKSTEYNITRDDGARYDAEVSPSVLKDASGTPIGIIATIRDITERKQAEEREEKTQQELAVSNRLAAIGELAAGVAHELNNPLTAILGFSQRLLRKSTDENIKSNLETIYGEALRSAKVVENLLTFARRREPKKEYSVINDIVHKALELRAYELRTGNIEVMLGLASGLPPIMVDFGQMQQVFLNIILNAEQAMAEAHHGGKLTIKTRKVEGYIRISFADNGPGIAAEHLDKLFNPFFTTRGKKGGTGLGLSICHGIVVEHGGKMHVKSKLGKGTTFFVELPVA